MIGQTLGHYRILEKLGQGGMGVVYRAQDTRLNRDVAIKMLPEALARDPERLARFEREARVLASLNHSNIAAIYGFERGLEQDRQEGLCYLVLEYVPGEILKGPMPVEDALGVCRQMAEGLEEAHEKGFMHRDLKPANVKVTPEGKVKLLDFGLAKAFADEPPADPSQSPTLSAGPTRAGMILGTAAYMSPEQARARPVDKRTDIWAFGCVLYELLAGRQAFGGESVSDTMVSILKGDPDWGRLPAETPPAIRSVLRRCLQKDPKQRVHDVADARIEIEEALALPAQPHLPAAKRTRRSAVVAVAAAGILAAAAFAGGMWWRDRGAPPATIWHGEMLGGSAIAFGPRVSPDGRMLAFQALVDGLSQVAVMRPDSGNWTVLTHDRSRGAVVDLTWSRDGTKIYFDRFVGTPRGIFSVPVLGGEERLVLEDAQAPQALPDGSLLIVRISSDRRRQLHRFWPESGRLQALPAMPSVEAFNPPVRAFPDGREAVFFGKPLEAPLDSPDLIYTIELSSGQTRRLAPQAVFDATTAQLLALAVQPDGRQVLFNLPAGNLHRIVAVPRDGGESLRTVMTLTMMPWWMDAGPDGSLYIDQVDRPGEVLRFAASGGAPERVAISQTYLLGAALPLPDGRVLFPSRAAGRDRLLVAAPGKDPIPLVDTQEETAWPATLVGNREVAFLAGTNPNRIIVVASLADGRIVRRLKGAKGAGSTWSLAASPDGKTLYYVASGTVWAIPSTDGEPRKICAGDSVAVDLRRQELIVQLNEKEGIRLVRVPVAGGGPEKVIPIGGELRLTPSPLAPNAVGKDGRIAVAVSSTDNWFWQPALLDPETGKLERVLTYPGDTYSPGWTADGRILSMTQPLRAALWRFRPGGNRK